MQHQTSQIESGIGVGGDLLDRVQIPADSEMFKDPDMAAAAGANAPAISANGEVDLGNVDLSQMDPEVIRVISETHHNPSPRKKSNKRQSNGFQPFDMAFGMMTKH